MWICILLLNVMLNSYTYSAKMWEAYTIMEWVGLNMDQFGHGHWSFLGGIIQYDIVSDWCNKHIIHASHFTTPHYKYSLLHESLECTNNVEDIVVCMCVSMLIFSWEGYVMTFPRFYISLYWHVSCIACTSHATCLCQVVSY